MNQDAITNLTVAPKSFEPAWITDLEDCELEEPLEEHFGLTLAHDEDNDEPVKYQKCDHVFDRDTMQYCPTCGQLAWGMDNSDWDTEDFDELLKAKKLRVECGEEGDYYVGKDVSGMKYEDLVKLNEVADHCKELFGKVAKIHEGAYYC